MEKSIYTKEYGVFARRLRESRRAAGIKQVELAARLGKTHSFVSRIERCEIRVDVVELRQICFALGVSFRKFVNDMEDELETEKE